MCSETFAKIYSIIHFPLNLIIQKENFINQFEIQQSPHECVDDLYDLCQTMAKNKSLHKLKEPGENHYYIIGEVLQNYVNDICKREFNGKRKIEIQILYRKNHKFELYKNYYTANQDVAEFNEAEIILRSKEIINTSFTSDDTNCVDNMIFDPNVYKTHDIVLSTIASEITGKTEWKIKMLLSLSNI